MVPSCPVLFDLGQVLDPKVIFAVGENSRTGDKQLKRDGERS